MSIERLIVENQLAMMRALGYDASSPFLRDLMRNRVAISERALNDAERDDRIKRDEARRTHAAITRNGKPKR